MTVLSSARWPTGTEYAASVQQPTTSFADDELRTGTLTTTPLGLPAMASGQSAVAFHMEVEDRPLAVRCFLSAHDDGRARYRALEEHVEAYDIPAVVAATWLDEGIRVHGRWWPVVIMPWVSGDPLHAAIEGRLDDPGRLTRLADRWLDLVESLQDREFAHGDLQHGNVLLTNDDDFQLVDLDGIWVPDMEVGAPNEYGHPNYQHINRSTTDWGPAVDTFSALVIAVSIMALAADASLARFMTGENLLFTQPDFEAPGSTAVWRALSRSSDPEVVDLAARVQAFAALGRPPAMSVRELLDASFDPASLIDRRGNFDSEPELPTAAPDVEDWWSGPANGPGSFWQGDATSGEPVAVQPVAAGAPGEAGPAAAVGSGAASAAAAIGHTARPVASAAVSRTATSAPAASSTPTHNAAGRGQRNSPVALITAQPVLAGLIGGAIAGLVGSLVAGALQAVASNEQVDGGLFVGMIAAMLGGAVHSWSSLGNAALAGRRFLIGAAVGLVAGIVAVFVADVMTRSTLQIGDTENAALVAYIWALTAALVGLAVGLLRSPKAAAYAFSGGAVAGFVGGFVHGVVDARFERRALQVNGFDPKVVLIAMFVAMLIGALVAVAIRTARNGSLTVVEGPGNGTVIDFHTNRVTVGGSYADTLVVTGRGMRARAIELDIGDQHASVRSDIVVIVDGTQQPSEFVLRSGQVMAFAGMFVRFDTASSSTQGVHG